MSLKKSQDTGSYVDNLKVKIAEEYKPPPKINIPMTHKQRLTFNKHIQNNLPNYDFFKESNILQKIKEWKNNRSINEEQRRIRLKNLREKENSEDDDEETVENNIAISRASEIEVTTVGSNCTTSYSNGMLMPTQASNYYSNILQPIPLSVNSNGQSYGSNSGVKSPFNISEFEADTSSPFDNVALKSINDVEELAKVLRIEDDTPKVSPGSYSNFHIMPPNLQNYPSILNYPSSSSCNTNHSVSGINGFYNSCDINPNRSFTPSFQCSPPNNYVTTFTNCIAPREKAKDVETTRTNDKYSGLKSKAASEPSKKNNIPVIPSGASNTSNLHDPFDELPKHLQEFSRNISSMGFPLSRVARTCKVLGDDNKKVQYHNIFIILF